MMNGLKNIKTHKIFDIEYNGYAYKQYQIKKTKNQQKLYEVFHIYLVINCKNYGRNYN